METNVESNLDRYASRHLIVTHWREPLANALNVMRESHVRYMPVVDDDDAIVGLVSERDVENALRDGKGNFELGVIVRDLMSWPVRSIDHEASLASVARLMIDEKISAAIVTDQARAVGIVTTEDLLRVFLERHETRGTSNYGEEAELGFRSVFLDGRIGQYAQALANIGI